MNCAGSILLKPAHLTSAQELHDVLAANLATYAPYGGLATLKPRAKSDGRS